MADTVKLLHTHMRGDRMFYFYEGETKVEKGIISIPADKPEWIRRAWVMGHRLDPETGKTLLITDILAAAAAGNDSSEEQDEDSDNGRQSGPDNGVRESEQNGSGDIIVSEPSSRVRRRTRKQGQRKSNATGNN